MKRNLREIITLAVNYWSGFLKEPTSFIQDNGGGNHKGTPGLGMLAMMTQMGQEYDSDKIEAFEHLLAGKLLNQAASSTIGSLSVDYHPCRTLTAALDESELEYSSLSIFPCKTSMHIDYDKCTATVSEGYSGHHRDLEEVLKEKLKNENSDIDGMLQVLKRLDEDPEEAASATKLLNCVSALQDAISNNPDVPDEPDDITDIVRASGPTCPDAYKFKSKIVGKISDLVIPPKKKSIKKTKRFKKSAGKR